VTEDPVRTCWERSRASWPEVEWSLEAYRRHLGEDPPPHPEDLYVAGAAGHRFPEAWSAIDVAYRTMVTRRLERSARADLEAEDLWSEAVARMMRDDPAQGNTEKGEPLMHLARYRGRTRLPWHFLAAARTIAIDRHRKHVRGPAVTSGEVSTIPAPHDESDQDMLQQEAASALGRAVLDGFRRLPASHQFLLAGIYRDGMTKADAGRVLDLSPWQTSRELRKAEEHLRLQVEHAMPGEWSRRTREAWARSWQECWNHLVSDRDGPDHQQKGTA